MRILGTPPKRLGPSKDRCTPCAPTISFASSTVARIPDVETQTRTPPYAPVPIVREVRRKAGNHRKGQGHREIMALLHVWRDLARETRESLKATIGGRSLPIPPVYDSSPGATPSSSMSDGVTPRSRRIKCSPPPPSISTCCARPLAVSWTRTPVTCSTLIVF